MSQSPQRLRFLVIRDAEEVLRFLTRRRIKPPRPIGDSSLDWWHLNEITRLLEELIAQRVLRAARAFRWTATSETQPLAPHSRTSKAMHGLLRPKQRKGKRGK